MSWRLVDWKPAIVVNSSGLADWQSPWVTVPQGVLLIFHAKWTAVAATAGTLGLQGSQFGTSQGVITLAPVTGWGTWPTVGATADSAAVFIKNPFRFMRLTYTRGGGGGASQFDVAYELRS